RFSRDWSSDVCSSDLPPLAAPPDALVAPPPLPSAVPPEPAIVVLPGALPVPPAPPLPVGFEVSLAAGSPPHPQPRAATSAINAQIGRASCRETGAGSV